jgi:hypothetical protein
MSQPNETVKLHYGKYLYKIKIINQLGSIFRTEFQRDGKLGYARKFLNEYNSDAWEGRIIKKGRFFDTVILQEELDDANYIYKVLRYAKNYLVRCEYNTLIVYSNNLNLINKLDSGIKSHNCEIWAPLDENIDYLKQNKNIILVDNPPELKYKVTFGRKKSSPALGEWLIANTDKSKAGSVFLRNCQDNGWINGQYVYVRDEKVLLLINMLAGDNITKIEELVCRTS